MADLDLEPHQYRRKGEVRDMGPKWYRNWFFISLIPLGFFVLHHDITMGETGFWGGVVFGGLSGMFLAGWLRYFR